MVPDRPELADPRLARPVARFELVLQAVIGFTWGPLLFYFLRHVLAWNAATVVGGAVLTFGLGLLGAFVPSSYFRLAAWERRGRGRRYERLFGIRTFKRWMSQGDHMNAWLRRRVPTYRVVAPTRESIAAYAQRTRAIERAHLAWFLGALVPTGYAMGAGAHWFGILLLLANLLTNVWPIMLQRYNRVRAEYLGGESDLAGKERRSLGGGRLER